MTIIKFILKMLLLPIMCVIILTQWIGIFLNGISATIFGILSTLAWGVALISVLFGQSIGRETVQMLMLGFVLFIIPHVGNWIIERIVVLRCLLGEFLHS